MVVQPTHVEREPTPSSPMQITALAGYQEFGDYLRIKRKQFGLLQAEMGERLHLTEGVYGFLERGRRAPQIDEIVSMFAALVEIQSDKRLPPMQIIEAETFFRLSKAFNEKKGKKRPNVAKQEWEKIEQQLISLVDHRQRTQIHLVSAESDDISNILVLESPDSRRNKALKDILKTDVSHLLERDEWVQRIRTYIDRTPQIKVSVIQAGMGYGKSSALALLTQQLAERDNLFLVPYQFKHSETMTPDDHLDEFLATLTADLKMRAIDETKQRPLVERIDQILVAVREHKQKVIILLDDAQEMFPSASDWSASWHLFFASLINEPHTATLYIMTREWPGWDERKRSFLEEEDLPELSLEAGMQLWKRQGFNDVDDDLLRKVCERVGQNPQGIEMLAFQYKRRGYSINWKGGSSSSKENPHTSSLKKLIESETLFSGSLDETSRRTLQQVFFNRLSGEDIKLLECLALSPLGIPFDLLVDQFDFAAQSFERLVNASFADLTMATSGRAAVVPLVREAMLQSLSAQRKEKIETIVTDIYAHWLYHVQDFRDDAEKAGLIAEMVVRSIRSRRLLEAAELYIGYGWLCTLFGHVARIQRVFDEMVKEDRGKELDAEHEVGCVILHYHIAINAGQKMTDVESEDIYQGVFDKVVSGAVSLQPHIEIDVLHNMMLKYIRLGHFQQANNMFEETLARINQPEHVTPEVYASYLHNKSRLLVRWSEAEKREGHQDDAQRLLLACVNILDECISQWRQCLKNALPLQEHYISFKLARALNDYAFRNRLLGNLPTSRDAIEESIRLKKACAALPSSLAISLSEYSQVLAAQGQNRLALKYNDEAVSVMKRAIEDGNTASSELGMLLIERADIYQQQAHLVEARQLLERAIDIIGDKRSRGSFRFKAENQIKEIRTILETTSNYQLDRKWFSRYHELASFDDLAWYAHAGPFTAEQQEEWTTLYSRRTEKQISDRMAALIVQSRQQEFVRSQQSHCAPTLYYPMIPCEEVQTRIAGFEKLQREIDTQEQNAIVCSFYSEAIKENLTILRQCEATAHGDQDEVWRGHMELYGTPETQEMMLALQPFCSMLLRAQHHEQAGPLAQELLSQFRSWGLYPEELAAISPLVPEIREKRAKLEARQKQVFSYEVVQRFLQDVFTNEYQTPDWKVAIAPARDYTYVDIDSKTVFLPPRSLTVEKIRDLLAEEIEVHAYRSMSGQHSPLALLSSGLAKYKATEEGLANHYVQQVSLQMHGESKSKSWISTLCIGLVCGVMTPQHSFIELCDLLEKAFLVNRLYGKRGETRTEMLADARNEAWERGARIFRGIPNLNDKGKCSLRDRIYLQGYMDVLRYLDRGDEQRLFVGKIKIEDLDMLAELDILAPYHQHQHLALSPNLLEHLSQYNK